MNAPRVERGLSVPERLILAGKHLFAQQGFENTTTAALAREAGTSESQLIKYFGHKEGLLDAIFDAGWQKFSFVFTAASVSAAPAEALRLVFELLIKMLDEDREMRNVLLFEARRIRSSQEIVLSEGYQRLVKEVSNLIAELIKDHPIRERIRPSSVASAWIGMLESMLRDHVMAERGANVPCPSVEEIRAMFQLVMQCFLHGAVSNKQ